MIATAETRFSKTWTRGAAFCVEEEGSDDVEGRVTVGKKEHRSEEEKNRCDRRRKKRLFSFSLFFLLSAFASLPAAAKSASESLHARRGEIRFRRGSISRLKEEEKKAREEAEAKAKRETISLRLFCTIFEASARARARERERERELTASQRGAREIGIGMEKREGDKSRASAFSSFLFSALDEKTKKWKFLTFSFFL